MRWKKPAHVPKVVGSGSCDSDIDANASLKAYLREQKNALAAIYAEIGIDPPEHHRRPVQAPPAPTPTPEPTPADPLRAEAQAVAARLATHPDDTVAQRRAAELLNLLEKNQ